MPDDVNELNVPGPPPDPAPPLPDPVAPAAIPAPQPRAGIFWWVAISIIVADQITKALVNNAVEIGRAHV